MMEMAARAHRFLGCKGASRSDFRWDDEQGEAGIYLLEVNTQPGMTPLEPGARAGEAAGHQLRRAGRAPDRGGAADERGARPARRRRPAKARKPRDVSVPKKIAKQLPINRRGNKLADGFAVFCSRWRSSR